MNSHLTVIFVGAEHFSLIILAVKTLSFIVCFLLISWDCFLFFGNWNCFFSLLVEGIRIFLSLHWRFAWFWIHVDNAEIIFYFIVWAVFFIFRFFNFGDSDVIWTLILLQWISHEFRLNLLLFLWSSQSLILIKKLGIDWRLHHFRNLNVLLLSG